MIAQLKEAASDVGIKIVFSNSREEIDVQINKMMRIEDVPQMLVSWDVDTTLNFDSNGFLENPLSKMVILLMSKAEDSGDESKLEKAQEMGELFQKFCQKLYSVLIRTNKGNSSPITESGYQLAPLYGRGHHSGIIGRLTIKVPIANC